MVFVLVGLALAVPVSRERLGPALASVAWLVFVAGGVLAWRFKRTSLVLAFIVLGLTAIAVLGAPMTVVAHDALALLVPINLAVLAWLPERQLFGAGGRARLVVIGAQAVVIALLLSPRFAPIGPAFAGVIVPGWSARAGALAQPAVVAFGAALVVVAVGVVRARRAEDAGLYWALAAAGLALSSSDVAIASTWLSTAALVLLVATVEASYGMAYGDELTGLPSRRALDNELRQLAGRYTIAMVDVDHFKKFNDTHGHPVGDQLLRMVARELGRVGGGGRAFRYGGEEFAVLFPNRSASEVLEHLERARVAIATTTFILRGADRPRTRPERPTRTAGVRRGVHVTVSIGVAAASRRRADPRAVLDAADAALYRAKDAGRNRVHVIGGPER